MVETKVRKIKVRIKSSKVWSRCKNVETLKKYKEAKKETKKTVDKVKTKAFDVLYQSLGNKGGKKIYTYVC